MSAPDSLMQRILDRTNGGLDIILNLLPDVNESIGNNRPFKLRKGEKTPSATIKQWPDGIWRVKDFGGDFSGNAINLYCYLNNRDFKTALKELGAIYNAFNDEAKSVIMPKIEKRPALETEETGKYYFEYKEALDQIDIETLFAKGVLQHVSSQRKENKEWYAALNNVCAKYAVLAVKSFTYIKQREAIVTSSTSEYPIFVIDGREFKKIYQPRSLDKKYRFRYEGKKTPDYIFGYARLIKEYESLISSIDDDTVDPDADVKSNRDIRLNEVIICSGDRDALNVAAMGYNVIWLNSESANLKFDQYLQLKKMCKAVYNLPDIDTTGRREGHKLAMEYLEIKTIQLPLELLKYKDWRGNPRKDIRDYLDIFTAKDFDKLVKSAIEYKFWDEIPVHDKDGNVKNYRYDFNDVRAYNFIQKSGFYRIQWKTSKDGYEYINIAGNIVRVITTKDIKQYINNFLAQRFTEDQKLRNTFYRSPRLKDDSLDNLAYIELDFTYYGKDFQFMFFEDCTWKITADKIEEFGPGQINKMVWDEKVIKHRPKLLDAPFTIKRIELADGTPSFDIEIHRYDCLFLRFLINTSRVFWRLELEERLDVKFDSEEERAKYREDNKFKIDGPLLSPEEIHEQKMHLINKLFVLGYMLFRHKEKSKPWAPFLMDHKLSAEGQSNGGSGKSIFARSVENFMNLLVINGKDRKLSEDKHMLENVDEKTELILVDDLDRSLNIESFFSQITEGMTVNPKYTKRFYLDYEKAPKIVFTSNFGLKDPTASAERRLVYAAFSDYYHDNNSGQYRETRTPANDFGKDLIKHFDDHEWSEFINTMAYSLQFHMACSVKVNPPMDNVLKRNLMGIMGDAFMSWADVYFSIENERLDCLVSREEAFERFKADTNQKYATAQNFMHRLEAWCKYNNYVLNPSELKNDKGRILRKWTVKNLDGTSKYETRNINGQIQQTEVRKTTEMLYVKTREGDLNLPKNTEPSLPNISEMEALVFPKDDELAF